ncbi:hypothetical protein KRE47_08365 [Elizabethkingia meningoseptica]|uniref:hypothetical protein n=1 Tax=Elizabethkingia meningoseptica TaxID=238 RepID=UPI0022F1589E|nr:hypothetical protein [Elizabethkingia meningoseptica]EJK5329693.1 hypothetical protein [Elizabethkingia meningoseptica]MDE5468048.1 hypothetical protein [Elizabethkingia meningoseptica]MDE5474967.1 hypothetical protein [Elizabethkingia meningoseptica]MDE5478400.1 hypothetical protein [Elizabethkingia meningoseptica]MDE5486799.1 hypothetical protein [Elizabethkingia meningoseptica]
MKYLFTLLILFLFTNSSQSQTPTREETFNYISNIINSSNGVTAITLNGGYTKVSNQLFSETEIKYQKLISMGSSQYSTNIFIATNIPWDALDMKNSKISTVQSGTQITPIEIAFLGSFNAHIERSGGISYNQDLTMNRMTIYVRNDKVDNMYKALWHLENICKTDDPFD